MKLNELSAERIFAKEEPGMILITSDYNTPEVLAFKKLAKKRHGVMPFVVSSS